MRTQLDFCKQTIQFTRQELHYFHNDASRIEALLNRFKSQFAIDGNHRLNGDFSLESFQALAELSADYPAAFERSILYFLSLESLGIEERALRNQVNALADSGADMIGALSLFVDSMHEEARKETAATSEEAQFYFQVLENSVCLYLRDVDGLVTTFERLFSTSIEGVSDQATAAEPLAQVA